MGETYFEESTAKIKDDNIISYYELYSGTAKGDFISFTMRDWYSL